MLPPSLPPFLPLSPVTQWVDQLSSVQPWPPLRAVRRRVWQMCFRLWKLLGYRNQVLSWQWWVRGRMRERGGKGERRGMKGSEGRMEGEEGREERGRKGRKGERRGGGKGGRDGGEGEEREEGRRGGGKGGREGGEGWRDQRKWWRSMEKIVCAAIWWECVDEIRMELKLGMNCSTLLSWDIMYQSHSQTGRPGNQTDGTVVPMWNPFSHCQCPHPPGAILFHPWTSAAISWQLFQLLQLQVTSRMHQLPVHCSTVWQTMHVIAWPSAIFKVVLYFNEIFTCWNGLWKWKFITNFVVWISN